MTNESTPFNIGDLAKPATTLIEKVSEGIGGLFAPYQIIRIAKADAKALEIKTDAETKALQIKANTDVMVSKIQTEAEIELQDYQRRAMNRLVAEETRKQINIESITTKAIEDLNEDSKPENIENDWIANFFDKCKLISDEEMQAIWGKVLAGQANNPGHFSKRTIEFMSTMSKEDALLFESLCMYRWFLNDRRVLIYDYEHSIYSNNNINFTSLKHLNHIGLIDFDPVNGYLTKIPVGETFSSHFDICLMINSPQKEGMYNMQIGNVILTDVGKQLLSVINQKRVSGFYDYVIRKWYNEGIGLSTFYPNLVVKPDIPYYKN